MTNNAYGADISKEGEFCHPVGRLLLSMTAGPGPKMASLILIPLFDANA